jgi:hypothetical protein
METGMAGSTFTMVSGASHGMLSGTTPGFTCTMNDNFYGADSFTFEMTDNGAPTYCTTAFCPTALDFYNATITITVNVFNDAPAITVDATEQAVKYRD